MPCITTIEKKKKNEKESNLHIIMSNIKYKKCRKIERRYYTNTFKKKKM